MILVVEQLTVKRGGRIVIDELALNADAGELVGIVGKNGCGKSTLLMAIAGASVWGSSRERTRARRQLGYVPELADPPGFLLAGELWALCAGARGTPPPGQDLGDALGLDELRELALERMSLGQRRRACLAAALLGPPQLLVLDEPDNGLDARRLEALEPLLRAHAAAGHVALVATHDTGLLERIGARVVELKFQTAER